MTECGKFADSDLGFVVRMDRDWARLTYRMAGMEVCFDKVRCVDRQAKKYEYNARTEKILCSLNSA